MVAVHFWFCSLRTYYVYKSSRRLSWEDDMKKDTSVDVANVEVSRAIV